MKNWKAYGLAAVTFLVAFGGTLVAQNVVQRYDSYSIGAPGFTLQATGSQWGQVQNVNSTTWGLGSGTTQSAIGTTAIKWDTSGLAYFIQTNKVGFGTTLFTPPAVGAIAQCTDCTNTYTLCVATGTGLAQWRQLISAGATNTQKSGCTSLE